MRNLCNAARLLLLYTLFLFHLMHAVPTLFATLIVGKLITTRLTGYRNRRSNERDVGNRRDQRSKTRY